MVLTWQTIAIFHFHTIEFFLLIIISDGEQIFDQMRTNQIFL